MSAPYWVMGGEAKASLSDLQQWLYDMEKAGVIVPAAKLATKREILMFIGQERRAYWNSEEVKIAAEVRKNALPAAEINAWLSSLPPMPLHGEGEDAV